jgi:hypothetical protein
MPWKSVKKIEFCTRENKTRIVMNKEEINGKYHP